MFSHEQVPLVDEGLTYNAVATVNLESYQIPVVTCKRSLRDGLEALVGDWGTPLLTPRSPTRVQGWDATSTP